MKLRHLISVLSALALAGVLLASCVVDRAANPATAPTRVLLAYIGTDNNLSGFEQEKLDALRRGWTGCANDHIVAYVDKGRSADARLIEISNLAHDEQPREIARYGDPEMPGGVEMNNSASWETLRRVIGDVLTLYPDADSYGLLIFSHASGWLPAGALTDPYKSFSDDTRAVIIDGDGEMELGDFAAAIPDGSFDYIVFEACFMAGIEVAYQLRDKADYIVASSAEIVHPGFTPVYPTATPALLSGNMPSFARGVHDNILTYADNELQRSSTLSVIRTAGLDALARFVRENCDRTLAGQLDVEEIQHFDRHGSYRLFFDFGDYCGMLLEQSPELSASDKTAKRAELDRLISDCVVWKEATRSFMDQSGGCNGFEIRRHSGLTVYIPQSQFGSLNERYGRLDWTKYVDGTARP